MFSKQKRLLMPLGLILALIFLCIRFMGMETGESIDSPATERKPVSISAYTGTETVDTSFLQQIHAPEAWNIAARLKMKDVVIATLDTGVDLNHPDIKPYLYKGFNLIDTKSPPNDDNGHGTNVTKVLVAVANNPSRQEGTIRIMPIKVLDKNGKGYKQDLAEGIRLAVRQKADVVLISAGLSHAASDLTDAIRYAEQQGVVVVAAAGNEGNAVKYPAALPTVIAVGGVDRNNQINDLSNRGPELDIVAPWSAYDISEDGMLTKAEGTSVAAPQVAAVAGLIKAVHPNLKPFEIRSLIRQTAQNNQAAPGWTPRSGFGIVQADRPLLEPYKPKPFYNGTSLQAMPLSVETMISSQFFNKSEEHWYYIESRYAGKVSIQVRDSNDAVIPVQLYHYAGGQETRFDLQNANPTDIKVTKARSYFRLQLKPSASLKPVTYKLTTSFHIDSDAFGDNHCISVKKVDTKSMRPVVARSTFFRTDAGSGNQ